MEADIRALHRVAPAACVVVLAVMQVGPGLVPFRVQIAHIDATLAGDPAAGGYVFVDLNPGRLAACGDRTGRALLLPDWVYPTASGYARIGPMVLAAFGDHTGGS